MEKEVRKVRISGKPYAAEVIKWGIGCDICPIKKWHPMEGRPSKRDLPQLCPDTGRLRGGTAEPIIKVDGKFYLGEYDFRPSREIKASNAPRVSA